MSIDIGRLTWVLDVNMTDAQAKLLGFKTAVQATESIVRSASNEFNKMALGIAKLTRGTQESAMAYKLANTALVALNDIEKARLMTIAKVLDATKAEHAELQKKIVATKAAESANLSLNRTLLTLGKATAEARIQFEIEAGALKKASTETQQAALATARLVDIKRAAIAAEKEQAAALAATNAALAKQRTAKDQAVNVIASRGRQLGSTLTTFVTAPVLGIDAAAISVGVKYEALLAKIQGLAGASANEIALMREQILALGPAIGRGPNELAEAMFHIYSEGYRGAKAMDVLTRAGKMAEIGMGDTKTNAQALVFTMHDMGISAKEAADILVTTVRVGNVATETLTSNLGKVLPVASLLGVQMRDVAGMFAVLTRSGLDAAMAATGIRQVLVTLLDTTPKTQKALKALHLSAYELREEMKTDLLGALQKIAAAANGNEVAFSKVFPNVRALTAALGTLAQQGGDARDIFNQVTQSTDGMDKAFSVTSATIINKFHKAMASLEVAGIKITAALTPTIIALTDHLSHLIDEFDKLSPETQKLFVETGLAVAALGPMVTILANLAAASRFADAGLTILVPSLARVGVAAGGEAAAGMAGLGIAFGEVVAPALLITGVIVGLKHYLDSLNDSEKQATKAVYEDVFTRAKAATTTTQHAKEVANLVAEFEKLRKKHVDTKEAADKMQAIMAEIAGKAPELIGQYNKEGIAIGLIGDAWDKVTKAAKDAQAAEEAAAQAAVESSAHMMRALATTQEFTISQLQKQKQAILAGGFQAPHFDPLVPGGYVSGRKILPASATADVASIDAQIAALQAGQRADFDQYKAILVGGGGKSTGGGGPKPLGNAPDTGGGGKTKAAKQSDEEKALDRLREKNQELAMSIALVGNESEETRTKMELAYGEYAKTGEQAKFTAAMEARFADMQNRVSKELYGKSYADLGTKGSKEESVAQVKVNNVVLASKFQEITKYYEEFKELSKEIDDYWNDLYKSVKAFNDKCLKEGAAFLKEQLKTYQDIITPAKELTNVQKAQLAIAEAQSSGKMMNPMDEAVIGFKAKQADNALAVRKHISDTEKEIALTEKEIEASLDHQFEALQKIAEQDKGYRSSITSMQIELLKAQGKWTPQDQAQERLGIRYGSQTNPYQQKATSIAMQIQDAITKTKEWTDLQNTLANDLSGAIVKGLTQGRGRARSVLAAITADINDSVKKIGEQFLQKQLEGVFNQAMSKLMPNFGKGIPELGQDSALNTNTDALINVTYGLEDLTTQLQISSGAGGQSAAGGGSGMFGSLGGILGGILGGGGGGGASGAEGSSGAAGQSMPSPISNAIVSPTSRATSVGATQAIHNSLNVSTGFVIKTSDPNTTVGIMPRITNTQAANRQIRARR